MGTVNMTGYTKLFGSILASTIWSEPKETKVLWITMLAMAGKHGEVHASIPGLAHAAHLTLEETQSSLKILLSADQYSRTKDHEGRRIEEIDGGWLILNHAKYRRLMNAEERKQYLAQKKAESRARQKESTPVNKRRALSTMSTHAEAEADTSTSTLPIQEVVEAWNSLGDPFPKVVLISQKRRTLVSARLKEKGWRDNFRTALEEIKKSPFCRGEVKPTNGHRRFLADFDWFLQSDSVAKIVEGKYRSDKKINNFGSEA